MKLYLGVGHGNTPTGKYQPGAIDPATGTHEHMEAHRVVNYTEQLMAAAGIQMRVEHDSGSGHDPNFQGSTKAANAYGATVCCEVHFDCSTCGVGGFALYVSEKGKILAESIRNAFVAEGLPVRPNQKRTNLYFLNETDGVAVLVECDRVHPLTEDQVRKMGQAIAKGLLGYEGAPAPAPPPAPPPPPPHQHPLPLVRVRNDVGEVYHPEAGRWFVQDKPWWEFRDIQEHLNHHEIVTKVDGIGGPRTDRNIRDFQRRKALSPDGIVGRDTWPKLHG